MDEGFLDKLKRQQSEEAFAKMEKGMARDELLSSMEPGILTEAAMMIGGPKKFTGPVEGLTKLFPKALDKAVFPELKNIFNIFKGLNPGEQKAAAKVLQTKITKDTNRLQDIYKNDIFNNPNATTAYGNLNNTNTQNYKDFAVAIEKVINPKGMNYGGIASMPLKYDL
tara:strand:+ start:102 stop:605 length:504 start_codon:yes stop_codon:yes gene_type:complete